MAVGDITWFDAALALDYYAGWATSDDIKVAVLDPTTAPTAATATPALGVFTEVESAGSYNAGGTSIGTWGTICLAAAAGSATIDSATNPEWPQNASNGVDATWGLIYNDTQAGDPAIAFIELGTVDMSAGSLTITWSGSGIATLSRV